MYCTLLSALYCILLYSTVLRTSTDTTFFLKYYFFKIYILLLLFVDQYTIFLLGTNLCSHLILLKVVLDE